MICPECDTVLLEEVYDGMKLLVCSRCQGIWLTRPKLEALLRRSAAPINYDRNIAQDHREHDDHDTRREHDDNEHDHRRNDGYYRHDDQRREVYHEHDGRHNERNPRRRGSWLTNILEGIGGGGED